VDLREVFESRRSVNFFDAKRNISEEELKKIYELASLCPSSFNLQPWKLLLISDAENKKKLRQAALNQPKVEESSVMIVLLADTKGYDRIGKVLDDMIDKSYQKEDAREAYVGLAKSLYGNDFAARGFALRNAGLFAMSFMLAAKYFGIDTHPMDGFQQNKVKEAFNIPDRYEVAMLIAVGYRDKEKPLLERLKRKSFDEVLVKETFR
jgi:nitroreductase